jgi:hypothetical protein
LWADAGTSGALPLTHGAFFSTGRGGREQTISVTKSHLLWVTSEARIPGLCYYIFYCLPRLLKCRLYSSRLLSTSGSDQPPSLSLPRLQLDIFVPHTMSTPHETISGTDVYGPGTFIDKKVLPVPKDAKRVFEFLASQTPGFTQNKAAWDTVHFEGQSMPMIPGPIKSAVMASAIHAMIGLVANELLELRDGKAVIDSSVTVDTDHAGLWLGSVFTTYIDGLDLSEWGRLGKITSLFPRDYERGVFQGIAGRTTAIYQTKDPKVWYQLHGSLNAEKALESMGIDASVKFDKPQEYYDYIQKHIIQWSPDELEMHNVRHGFCGSICYSPEGWRKTEMGKRLDSHPLINFSEQTYAKSTPPVPLVKGLPDRRPLAGIKVLEMVRIIAGPQIGVTLASYGADVIRVNCSRLVDLNVNFTLWSPI